MLSSNHYLVRNDSARLHGSNSMGVCSHLLQKHSLYVVAGILEEVCTRLKEKMRVLTLPMDVSGHP